MAVGHRPEPQVEALGTCSDTIFCPGAVSDQSRPPDLPSLLAKAFERKSPNLGCLRTQEGSG